MKLVRTIAAFGLAAGVVAAGVSVLRPSPADSKLLVGRIWIDRLPKQETEHAEVVVVLDAEPIALFQRASRFEGSWAMYRYELRGDEKIQLLFPQDKTKHEVGYKAAACDVKGFDYCLDLTGAPRGAKRYHSRKEWVIEAETPEELDAELRAFRTSIAE